MNRKEKLEDELKLFRTARNDQNYEKILYHLGRAHVLSQNSPWQHLRIHFIMFLVAVERLDFKEISGQVLRLLVTIPGHLFGKVPKGNIGWSSVGLTEELEIPSDLKEFI